MEELEQPAVNYDGVEFPDARLQVVAMLSSLARPAYQQRVWLADIREPGDVDDLTMVINILDDTRVLEDPEGVVGEVLRNQNEARAMRELTSLLYPLIDELGEAPDSEYLASRRWPAVVEAARKALRSMA
ncbi:hypothetical protein DEJ50_00145 [Streptomyces venezuelae]|uniref:Uncharacterized protein n=1 Tax=Streptomyces venezuelae TaxID=54571 RepID=A0A5P2CWZ1_STRVZ|nr:hypothetical protein [Streptomyces venezuelae]QES46507.1 hypothetical protein DEJ50_00145 [Streptomyces venezuelae]